jgi:hypothetical protein
MFSLTCGTQIQKINIYTKATWSYANSYIEHICSIETIVWNLGK